MSEEKNLAYQQLFHCLVIETRFIVHMILALVHVLYLVFEHVNQVK